MNESNFTKICKELIIKWYNKNNVVKLNESEIYVVWLVKVLQNNKALLSTTIPDSMYYEVTYNGDKKEFYLDAYKKVENVVSKQE